jgi:hypothetical protein
MAQQNTSTLKGTLIFGGITLAVALFFVGPEGNEGIAGEAAEGLTQDELIGSPGASGRSEIVAAPRAEQVDDSAVVWADDEEMIDDAQGFDPSPYSPDDSDGDTAPGSGSLGDDGEPVEVRDAPLPQAGQRVPDHLLPS